MAKVNEDIIEGLVTFSSASFWITLLSSGFCPLVRSILYAGMLPFSSLKAFGVGAILCNPINPVTIVKNLHWLIRPLRLLLQMTSFLRGFKNDIHPKERLKNNQKKPTSISHVLWASVSVASSVLYTHDLSAHKPELTGRSLQLSSNWQT